MSVTLSEWLSANRARLAKGPIAILLDEDGVERESTLHHMAQRGFALILALAPRPAPLPEGLAAPAVPLVFPTQGPGAHVEAVNAVIDAVPPGTWLHYAFNAEYLFYPFSDTRSVRELLDFTVEERRASVLTYVIDLYPPDLQATPLGVAREEALFDTRGYYALGRRGRDGAILEDQLDFHGGLRWRCEEFLPADRLRIDRVSLFRARPGLRLLPDHRLNDEALNTYQCPWHHSMTAALASFRVAKALARNPRSRGRVGRLEWRHSARFEWTARQLMDAGMMEPGQWF